MSIENKQLVGGSGKYLQMPYVAPLNSADSWEFMSEFYYNGGSYPTLFSSYSPYLDSYYYQESYGGYHMYKAPRLLVSDSRLYFQLSSNGSSWNISNRAGLNTLLWARYRVKAGFTGDTYYVKLSTFNEGTNPTLTTDGSIGGTTYACASSGTGYYGSNRTHYAFLNTLNHEPCRLTVYNNTCWVTYYTPTPIVPTGIQLTNYSSGWNVKNAVFQASNNGSDWEDIYTINDHPNDNYLSKDYTWQIEKAYKYFRLYITAGYYNSYVDIENLKIYGFSTPKWEEYADDFILESTERIVCERPFMFFNSPYSIYQRYLTGPVNLTNTSFKYTTNGEEHTYFNGETDTQLGFFNYNCLLENNVASGFSTDQYIVVAEPIMQNNYSSNTKMLFRVRTNSLEESSIVWDSINDAGIGIANNTGRWKLYGEGYQTLGNKVKKDTWYWVAYTFDGLDHKLFVLEDTGTYTLSNLPKLPRVIETENGTKILEPSVWEFQLRRRSRKIYFGNKLFIGFNNFATQQYWHGEIDLKYTLIGSNIINYQVNNAGYFPKTGNITIPSTQTISVSLDSIETAKTFTIEPTPEDATVELSARGYLQSGNSITVPVGTTVAYKVYKEDYATKNGTVVVTENIVLPVELPTEVRLIPDLTGYGPNQFETIKNEMGIHISTTTATESNLIDSLQDTPENQNYPRWQTYTLPAYAQIYYPGKVMTMSKYTIKCRYEHATQFHDRLLTGWRVWGILTDAAVDLNNTSWKNNATLLSTGSSFTDLPPNETMREFLVDTDKTNIQFNSIIFEATNRYGGGASYTTIGQLVFYGTKTTV